MNMKSLFNYFMEKELNDENFPSRTKFWLNYATQDCFFVVGPEEHGMSERIGAVKGVLCGFSEPFRAMLQDSQFVEEGDVRITDIEPETFRNFLRCIYGAEDIVIPQLSFEAAAKLLYVFEKYLVTDLKPIAVEHLSHLLSSETLFLALLHPVCLHQELLEKRILEIVQADVMKVLSDARFLNLCEISVKWLVQKENLNVREIDVWNAVLKWAKHKEHYHRQNDLRSYMQNLLPFFRFLSMDFKDFCKDVIPSDVLTKSEVYEICKSFGTSEGLRLEHISACKTNQFIRRCHVKT